MIVLVALVAAYAAGVDMRRLTLLAGAVYLPEVVATLALIYWWRSRSVEDDRPVLFCESVASELRAGASLRGALTTAVAVVGNTSLSISSPLAEVAAQVSSEFPAIGEELELTVVNAGRSGSDVAGLFDEIGSLALAKTEIRREVRTATAPGRATAMVLVGAPLFYIVTQMGSGGLERMLASSQQRYVALVGLGLFLAGLVVTSLIVWRSGR